MFRPKWPFVLGSFSITTNFQLAKYRAMIDRCAPHLRELSLPALGEYNVGREHWAMMRRLRHLRFDSCVSSDTLRAVADNLTSLQSIHFSDIVSLNINSEYHFWAKAEH